MGCLFSRAAAPRTQLGALVEAPGWAGARRWGTRLWAAAATAVLAAVPGGAAAAAASPPQVLAEAAALLKHLFPDPATAPGLVVAIDYTASNSRNGARTFGGRCLHTVALSGGRARENFYERALRACAPLHAACGAPAIAVYGFGDVHTADTRVFSFLPRGGAGDTRGAGGTSEAADAPGATNSGSSSALCANLGAAVARYREITPAIVLGGPTSFVASIERACAHVEAARRAHALVLVVDDPPANCRANLEALVAASRLALYVVAVGVGDSAFLALRELERTAALDCNFPNLTLVHNDDDGAAANDAGATQRGATLGGPSTTAAAGEPAAPGDTEPLRSSVDTRCLVLAARIAHAVAAQAVAAREAGAQFG